MKKKILAGILAATFLMSVLAGCTGKPAASGTDTSSTTAPSTASSTATTAEVSFPLAEPITMTMFAHSVPGQELGNTLVMKVMEEKTNVKWNITTASDTEIVEKLNLSFNSGDYFDVYMKSGISGTDTLKYAQEEIIIPLNDLIDKHMPNLKAVLDEQKVWGDITSGDGKIYALPQLNGKGATAPPLFINQAWLDKLNLKMPTNEEEFLKVLRAFKTGDPNGNGKQDEMPVYLPQGAFEMLFPYFGINCDYNTMSMYNSKTGKIEYVPTSEKFKHYLSVMRTMYEEGLCNKDCFSAPWDQLNALATTQDVIGVFPSWGAYTTVGTEKDEMWPMLFPFDGNTFPCGSGVGNGALLITDKCKKPEIVAKWADTFYNEEGGRLAWMGVDGQTYKLNADGTYEWLVNGSYGADITTIRNTQGLFGNKNAPCVAPKLFNEGQTNPEELYLFKERQKMYPYFDEPTPTLSWTDVEIEEKSTLVASINPFFAQFEAQVTTGEKNLKADWDAYLKAMQDMKVNNLIAIDQAAYTRFLDEAAK